MKKTFALITVLLAAILVFVSCDTVVEASAKALIQAEESVSENVTEAAESEPSTDTVTESKSVQTDTTTEHSNEIYGSYARPNENSPVAFTITLSPNGSYSYYETAISSHMGFGRYTIDGNIITIVDDDIPTASGSRTYTFKFEYRDEKLFFLASESDSFMYVDLPEGAEFEHIQTGN